MAQGYAEKLSASYDWLVIEIGKDAPSHVGHVAVATVLSWLQFRELPAFRLDLQHLSSWFRAFERRASMQGHSLVGRYTRRRLTFPDAQGLADFIRHHRFQWF